MDREDLTDAESALLGTVRRFCEEELTEDRIRAFEEAGGIPEDLYRRMADLGWLGLSFPEKYGGSGADIRLTLMVIEELCYGAMAVGNAYFRSIVNGGLNVLRSGTDEQRHAILPGLVSGEVTMAFAMTEPDAGSDVSNIATTARRVDGHYELTGTKTFITGARGSDWLQVFARSGDGGNDISVFLVDGSHPNISYDEIPKLGNLAAPTFTVTLDHVWVPETALLGAVHGAWDHVKASLDLERVAVATECIGAARACVDEAIAYARQRHQFGRPIIEFQALRHKLVDMHLELEAARSVTYRAADLIAEGRNATVQAAAAKYLTGLAYHRCAIDGMSVLGGYGYATAYPLARHLRDASLYRIVPGAEVLKDSIARRVLR